MTLWPVIERELREESRRPINYIVRCVAAGILVGGCFWVQHLTMERMRWITGGGFGGGFLAPASPAGDGQAVFAFLHYLLFLGVWTLGPLLTADCISREKREGTLGLLFLTPLKAGDIVTAKWISHGIRLLTVVLASVPVILVPVLMGGVSWMDGVCSLLLNLSALCLALSAGMAASSLCREWARAMILAVTLALLVACMFLAIHLLVHTGWQTFKAGKFEPWYVSQMLSRYGEKLPAILGMATGEFGPRGLGSLASTRTVTTVLLSTAMLGVSLLLSGLVLVFATVRMRRSWMETGRSARQVKLQQTFCSPLTPWRQWFRRSMARNLDRNPIGWLQRRSWSARVTTSGWLVLVIGVQTVMISAFAWPTVEKQQFPFAMLLAAGLAFTAVGSFRREKQTGAFELLLVTPLTARQIVDGRLRGIWRQFLPAFGILVMANLYLRSFGDYGYHPPTEVFLVGVAGALSLLPLAGLYFGLRRKSHLVAWLQTLLVFTLLPWLLLQVVLLPVWLFVLVFRDVDRALSPANRLLDWLSTGPMWAFLWLTACGIIGIIFRARLIRMLVNRTFASA